MGNIRYEDIFPFHFIDLNCTGSEDTIWDCPSNSLISQYSCLYSHDAAVSCHKFNIEYANCTNGQMKISGTSLKGRVEICYNNVWFGVCPDSYNSYNKPKVICSALGLSPEGASGYSSAFNDLYDVSLIPYEFRCNGNEKSLLDCRKYTLSCSSYSSSNLVYAGVTCQYACKHGDIRLTGSSYEVTGRIQVCINGTWNTICGTNFDSNDASVACRQLGYSPYGAFNLSYYYYFSSDPVYFYNLNCTGSESSIWECPYTLQGNCPYRNRAAIRCQYVNDGIGITGIDTACNDGAVRLVGGVNELEGNVEICYNNLWGSVCHRSWGTSDADVVCKQLGYQSKGSKSLTYGYFGDAINPLISSLSCSSSYTYNSLLSCSYDVVNTLSYCGDSSAAGVVCVDLCEEGSIRLSGSTIQFAGRVEICIENTWTTLCDQTWDLIDAQVACRELGYSPYGAIPTHDCYTEGQLSFGITSLNCTGNETNLINCSHSNPSLYNCRSHNDAGLVCQRFAMETNCSNGEVRLMDGSVPHEGRVEICLNGVWGSICSNSWNNQDSNVVCGQLGFLSLGSIPRLNAQFGHGSGPVLMSHLYCSGSEHSLLDCTHQSCGVTSCTHHSDAGVTCEVPCINGTMRLGSNAVLRGRVEYCVNNSWVTICRHHWTASEATVVCSQLGYSPYGAIAFVDYSYNVWPLGIYQLHCNGNETTIEECQYDTNGYGGCSQYYVANVVCLRKLYIFIRVINKFFSS
jgi:deleted-in-malignant-brain-tumors protein 1